MLKKSVLLAAIILLSSCSSTKTGTEAGPPEPSSSAGEITIEEVKLTAKNLVHVKLPAILDSTLSNFEGSGWTKERFTYSLQTKIIDEFNKLGIKAVSDSVSGASQLEIIFQEYKPADPSQKEGHQHPVLKGRAVLTTKAGVRNLNIQHNPESLADEGTDGSRTKVNFDLDAMARIVVEKFSDKPKTEPKKRPKRKKKKNVYEPDMWILF